MTRNTHDNVPLWRRGVATIMAIGTTAIGVGVSSGCTADQAPTPVATASKTWERNDTIKPENWADYTATTDKYPDAATAAEHLIGDADGNGLYSRILRYAGRRGEDTTETMLPPKEALVALFGPEPADGYPASVLSIIEDMSTKYNLFAGAYLSTMYDPHPFECEVSLTDIATRPDGSVTGVFDERCVAVGLPGDNKVDFTLEVVVILNTYTDPSTGKEAWCVKQIEDGKKISLPHEGDSTTID